jgi:hypothetical protein
MAKRPIVAARSEWLLSILSILSVVFFVNPEREIERMA